MRDRKPKTLIMLEVDDIERRVTGYTYYIGNEWYNEKLFYDLEPLIKLKKSKKCLRLERMRQAPLLRDKEFKKAYERGYCDGLLEKKTSE